MQNFFQYSNDYISIVQPATDHSISSFHTRRLLFHYQLQHITLESYLEKHMHAHVYRINTCSVLPDKPVISPSCASTTVDVSTSPDPVTSTMSINLGSPVDVTCKHRSDRAVLVWLGKMHTVLTRKRQ